VLVFEDGEMRLYAKADENGERQAIPAFDDNTRGYRFLPIQQLAPYSDQFWLVKKIGSATWWRVVPDAFLDDEVITEGSMSNVLPGETHKYTVVIWLEGDDPHTTDELIDTHAGVALQFWLVGEEEDGTDKSGIRWAELWNDLKFWED